MMELALATFTLVAITIAHTLGKHLGREEGAKAGTERAERILIRSMEVRVSPTAHQALICIAGNQSMKEMVEQLEKPQPADAEGS